MLREINYYKKENNNNNNLLLTFIAIVIPTSIWYRYLLTIDSKLKLNKYCNFYELY